VQTLTDMIGRETASRSIQVRVVAAFAAIAFMLAAVGIHGLLSFAVSQRTQEIGVRVALGAQRGDILGMVVRRSVALAIAGVIPGAALAYAAGRSMEALLAGVKPTDGLTLVSARRLVRTDERVRGAGSNVARASRRSHHGASLRVMCGVQCRRPARSCSHEPDGSRLDASGGTLSRSGPHRRLR
jgi:ABC-type antimicrobial peptide transport system permease subunit